MGANTLISENLAKTRDRIAGALKKSGRSPEDVQLVAVSKTVDVERIVQARECGQLVFGENKIQEAKDKVDTLGTDDYEWHFIGHLQKNKIKFLFDRFSLIHSVDSVALAESIHHASENRSKVTPILVQVNISGEASKQGVAPEQLESSLKQMGLFSGVSVRGLMTIPPFDPDPEQSRTYFIQLRELRGAMNQLGLERVSLDHLSMGMSNDFEVAIEEGATLVRVGTAIFGNRA